MKFLHLSILLVFFASCNKQDVKIPVNDNPGIHEVWDNSRIYILTKVKNGDTLPDLQIGQTMSTTQWLVAVDRRLRLKKLIAPIEKILKKRHKKSIHSKEGTHAYFTYLDSTQHKISFIDFDSIQIMPDYFQAKSYFEKYHKTDSTFNKFFLTIKPNSIALNDSIVFKLPVNKNMLRDSLWNYIGKQTGEKTNRLYINFDSSMYFDKFLDYYTFLKNNPIPKGKLSEKIFIFTSDNKN